MSPRTPNVVLSVGDNYELAVSLLDEDKWVNLAVKERWSAPGTQRKVHDAAYPVEQLRRLLGGCCAQPSADCEAAAELGKRAEKAEAKLAKVIAELENSDAYDLTIKTYNRLHRAATEEGNAQFTLPTEAGAGVRATGPTPDGRGYEVEFRLYTDAWRDHEGHVWSEVDILTVFWDHRLIEAGR
ncbi:hypothetical protein [Sinomonas soli]